MPAFWEAALSGSLARNALFLALLASVACGVMGSYVVTRRITYVAAAIAHCILGGVGAVRFANVRWGWEGLQPIHGALGAAVLAALVVGAVTLVAREREDTIISAVWALGMAAGILFMYGTPGYNQDLMSFLFGTILLVPTRDLWLMAGLDAVVVGTAVVFFAELQAVSFDEEFARLRGLPVNAYYLLLLVLVGLTVVLLVSVVGIILVIALLTLPVAIAGRFATTLAHLMALSALVCGAVTVGGLTLSYGPDLPPGPVIVVTAAGAYGMSLLIRRKGRSH